VPLEALEIVDLRSLSVSTTNYVLEVSIFVEVP